MFHICLNRQLSKGGGSCAVGIEQHMGVTFRVSGGQEGGPTVLGWSCKATAKVVALRIMLMPGKELVRCV